MTPLLTIEDLAAVLGMTPGAIRTARYRNPDAMPPAVKLGNSLRWDPTDVAPRSSSPEKRQRPAQEPPSKSSLARGRTQHDGTTTKFRAGQGNDCRVSRPHGHPTRQVHRAPPAMFTTEAYTDPVVFKYQVTVTVELAVWMTSAEFQRLNSAAS